MRTYYMCLENVTILGLRMFEHQDMSTYGRADTGTLGNNIKTNIVYVSKTKAVHLYVDSIYSYRALVLMSEIWSLISTMA